MSHFNVRTNVLTRSLLTVAAAGVALASTLQAQSSPNHPTILPGGGGSPLSAGAAGRPAAGATAAPSLPAVGAELANAAAVAGAAKSQPAAAAHPSVVQVRPILLQRPVDSDHGRRELSGNFSSEALSEQATHITVGRSIFIDSKKRLARIYITDPEIIDSYTASPTQLVVTAKKAGATTLIMWDETGESRSYLVSSDLNVDMLRDSLQQALPTQAIKVLGSEGRVVLTGIVETKDVGDAAVKIASLYSKDVSNSMVVNTALVKQVRLEVKIVEADRSKLAQFGFNFFSNGGQNPGSTTTGQYPSQLTTSVLNGTKNVVVTNPLNFSLYINRFNIGATLQDLETMQVLQILAEPNIVAMSGQKANFLAGGEFPFPIVQSSSTGAPVVTLMFKPYGVKLEFLPIVNSDGTIDLKVSPEVSALDYANAVNISGYTIPAISSRRAETEVVLKSGQTFAISGLLDKRTTDLYSKTPGAASLPVLGPLFKSKAVNHTDTELIVIVTPTLVDPVGDSNPALIYPPDPNQTIPMLDKNKFDKELPSAAKK